MTFMSKSEHNPALKPINN